MNRVHDLAAGLVCSVLWAVGCGGSAQLSSGGQDLNTRVFSVDSSEPENRGKSTALGEVHLESDACQGIDTAPVYEGNLRVDDLMRFLEAQNLRFEKTRAREDLHYLDIQQKGRTIRLRVATLDSARAAGRDLHEAMLEHGQGSWGVHRANLAVLGPVSSPSDILAFSVETKLACWGVLTIAGRDDNFVISGGYTEL